MKAGIAGAGILGRLMALELVKAGWSVTLFDQHQIDPFYLKELGRRRSGEKPEHNRSYVRRVSGSENALRGSKLIGYINNCSIAAAGLLTPMTELDKCPEVIFALGHAALTLHWPDIVDTINAHESLQRRGTLVISHPNDAPEVERFTDIVNSKLNQTSHQIYPLDLKKQIILNQANILDLEPELTKWTSAFYFEGEGCVDNHVVLEKLIAYLSERQVQFCLDEPVLSIKPSKIVTERDTYDFDWVVDCRGLGAKEMFSDLRGVRGESILLHAPDVTITRPVRLLNPKYSLYIVPKKNKHYVLGASEIESEDRSPISVRTALELLTSAYYVHPGFLEARIIKTISQLRPTLSDHLPKIKYTQGLIAINGLYRHGFLIAPSLVKDVLDYIQQGILSVHYADLWENIDANHFI
jgi:glycine oxidase